MNFFGDENRLETCDDCGNTVAMANYRDGGKHITLVDTGFYCPRCVVLVNNLLILEGFLRKP